MINKIQLFKNKKDKKKKMEKENYAYLPIKDKNIKSEKNSILKNYNSNDIDNEFWIECKDCKEKIFKKDLENNFFVCPKCNKHMRMDVRDRINMITDKGSFVEINKENETIDPIKFPNYMEKVESYKNKTNESESVVTGICRINGMKSVLCVMNPNFMMGSMGSITGDKITYAFEYGAEHKMPVIICSASGGARMQEGMFSLMQMAKTSQAAGKLSEAGQIYISILTDPTTGGVAASFAMLGDIIISEPKTLIGFAGKRVVSQTIGKELPENFQTAEFMLEHGFLDMIVDRKNLKETLYKILYIHKKN
ncbi:acetyl-CoA carboxylase, carboxyltransferase subunit beta [Peptacetobacter sp.]|uniref:acetyl-CoA carboxylase, carboxyltransferase subunit beta n=1 Tax=Peptacetobacter sp. TaxID=2991975 RepID=UPI00261AC1AD|nr:acetyl-CoA carboxylase, carboxyltransferase subunit beta [Peptacetobacter sp.]